MKLTKICLQCKKEFAKPYNESLNNWFNRHKYCSRECYVKSMKGKDLFKNGKRCAIPWNKDKKFPEFSKENSSQWKGGLVTLICIYCGKKFKVKPHRKDIAKYCSKKCHWNDNLGLTSINERERKSNKYKEWRLVVFERDNYTCQNCGIRSGNGKAVILNADHIKPFAYFPELRFELSNGITLCEECHRQTDTFGAKAWRTFNNMVALAKES